MRISDWSSDVCSSDLRLFGLLAGARPGIEELTPIIAGDIFGDAVIFGPAVLGQVEGAEHLVDPREMDREIDVERLALEPMVPVVIARGRSEEHKSELQSLMRTAYAVFCLKHKPNH